jgi:hypothetical protein
MRTKLRALTLGAMNSVVGLFISAARELDRFLAATSVENARRAVEDNERLARLRSANQGISSLTHAPSRVSSVAGFAARGVESAAAEAPPDTRPLAQSEREPAIV